MNNNRITSISHSILCRVVILLLLLTSTLALAEDQVAGEVTMLVGQADATTATGTSRSLKKGAKVYVGDTLETGKKCYIKIKYTDGTTILLRPDTGLVINAYKDGAEGGESVATLLKGGLRSVTGAISQDKKNNTQIKTPVATLGIRGTDFVMRLCQDKDDKEKNDCDNVNEDGLYTSTYDGGTSLTNGAGTLNSESGEHAYVPGFNVPPVQLASAPRVIALDNLPNPLDSDARFIPGNACGSP